MFLTDFLHHKFFRFGIALGFLPFEFMVFSDVSEAAVHESDRPQVLTLLTTPKAHDCTRLLAAESDRIGTALGSTDGGFGLGAAIGGRDIFRELLVISRHAEDKSGAIADHNPASGRFSELQKAINFIQSRVVESHIATSPTLQRIVRRNNESDLVCLIGGECDAARSASTLWIDDSQPDSHTHMLVAPYMSTDEAALVWVINLMEQLAQKSEREAVIRWYAFNQRAASERDFVFESLQGVLSDLDNKDLAQIEILKFLVKLKAFGLKVQLYHSAGKDFQHTDLIQVSEEFLHKHASIEDEFRWQMARALKLSPETLATAVLEVATAIDKGSTLFGGTIAGQRIAAPRSILDN